MTPIRDRFNPPGRIHDRLLNFEITESGFYSRLNAQSSVFIIQPATDLADSVSFALFHEFVKEKPAKRKILLRLADSGRVA